MEAATNVCEPNCDVHDNHLPADSHVDHATARVNHSSTPLATPLQLQVRFS